MTARAAFLLAALLVTTLSPARAETTPVTGSVVYTRAVPDEPTQLWVRDTATWERRFLGEGANPRWSPDGEWLLFERHGVGLNAPLFKARADGSELTQLTPNDFRAYGFDWSPDGTQIVFSNGASLHVMSSDGSGPTPLVDDPETCAQQPAWSPDGSQIAFTSFPMRQGGFLLIPTCTAGITDSSPTDIYRLFLNSGDTPATPLTQTGEVQETNPRWPPTESGVDPSPAVPTVNSCSPPGVSAGRTGPRWTSFGGAVSQACPHTSLESRS